MARPVHDLSSLKLNEVSANLQTGITALKWPEDPRKPPTPNSCHLSVDAKGFYLICQDKCKNEIECFDIALIHDTRTGSQVSLPPGIESFDPLTFGILDAPYTSNWLSIYYGNTFVVSNGLRIIHFIFRSRNIAREWAEQLFRYGHNPLLRNLSSLECLEKIHTKIIYGLTSIDKPTIPVRNLIQFLCKNNRDFPKETKICETLEDLKLPNKIDAVIDRDQFTFKKFFRFYMHLMNRHEIPKIFDSIGGKHRRYINWENLNGFIKKQNNTHEDPFGIDYYEQRAKDLIRKYTQYEEHSKEKGMCEESFLRYLLSFDNLILNPTILDLYMDMTKPLSHYFIASSHNTYLRGSQWTGRASVEMYRQVLLTGCRCIELDVVESGEKNDEPEITHIHTRVKPIPFIEVLVAIREYAFKVTSYPLILSIENHCGSKAQAKMAQYFVDVFGENLITEPLHTHPCEENSPLPSPHDLQYKILIKNKKLQPKTPQTILQKPGTISATSSSGQSTDANADPSTTTQIDPINSIFKESCLPEDVDVSDDDDKPVPTEVQTTTRESKPTKVMSDLVVYIVPVHFKTFARSEEQKKNYEMSSFPEDKGYSLIRDHAKEFLAYNQRQLSRIYPRGTRFDSSNYNPYIFWPIGCQMVALNYQTLDIPMQLNLGLFSFNGACGYIEKPSALCQSRSLFDPRIQTNLENVVSYQLEIKIFSGQFLCQDREPTFVDIQMYGMYGDINKRHEYRIRAKRWNGFQAIYDENDLESEESFYRFSKVILPDMAAIRFSVTAEDGSFLGQCFLPIAHLRSGYRHVVLRNQMNLPINSSSLFVFIRRNIYVNAKDQKLTDELVEPLVIHSSNINTERNNCDRFSSNMFVRFHNSPTNELEGNSNRRNSSDESDWYQKHVIAGSELNNQKRLCQILSLNDIDQREIQKREQNIHGKLRRISIDYQSRIEQGKVRFQECLDLHQDRTIMTNNSSTRRRSTSAINKKDIEQIKQCLLKIYSEKLSHQEELEYKYLTEYYKKIEKEIKDDYHKRLNQIHGILKTDKSRVNKHARAQLEKELNDITKKETDRDRITMLKQRSSQRNARIGALTFQMLEDLYEEVKRILETNLQINLHQLEEQRAKDVEICLEKYSNRFTELKRQLHGDEYDTSHDNSSSSSCRSKLASTSMPTMSQYSSEVTNQ